MFLQNERYPIYQDLSIVYQRTAYDAANAAARRWGNLEFLLIPVCGLVTRVSKSPLRVLELSDIEAIVIHGYIEPPFQNNTPSHTSIQRDKRDEVSDWVTDQLTALRKDFPRLGVFAKFHRHPFYGGRFLSGGDIRCNLEGENYSRWVIEHGMRFVPMQVSWPVRPGHDNITTFIQIGKELNTTSPPIIMSSKSRYNCIYKKPFWLDGDLPWANQQKRELKDRWGGTTRKQIGRGWIRYYVPTPTGRKFLLAVPPDFPTHNLEVHELIQGKPELIDEIGFEKPLEDISLVRVIERALRG